MSRWNNFSAKDRDMEGGSGVVENDNSDSRSSGWLVSWSSGMTMKNRGKVAKSCKSFADQCENKLQTH